jgi:hypothetical protein
MLFTSATWRDLLSAALWEGLKGAALWAPGAVREPGHRAVAASP